MDKLKRTFLEKRFLQIFNKFNKLFTNLNKLTKTSTKLNITDYKYISELGKDFDKLTEHIQNKTVINIINCLLNRFYRMLNFGNNVAQSEIDVIAPQITAQILLSAYVISGYPEFALSAHHHQLEAPRDKIDRGYDVYQLSKDVVNNLNNASNKKGKLSKNDFYHLIKSINMYANCFIVWKNADQLDKTNELMQRIHYTNKTMDEIKESSKYSDEQRIETLAVLEDQKTKIIDSLKTLNPNIKEKNVELYSKLTDEMSTQYQKAYWDLLTNELENNKYDFFIKIMNDIASDFKKLRPNKETFHEKVENTITTYCQPMNNNINDSQKFIKLIETIIEWITQLQSPARKSETIELWNTMKEAIENNYLGDHSSYIPKTMEFVCTTIQDIKDDLLTFYVVNTFK